MKTTIVKNADGSITVSEDLQINDASGKPQVTTRQISAAQISAHRKDATFEAALQAAAGQAGNLTAQELAGLPAAK